MYKLLLSIVFLVILNGCSQGPMGGDVNSNIEKFDKIYGKCNNPHRQYTYRDKQICESKLRAAGPDGVVDDPINITEIFDRVGGKESVVYGGMVVNQNLWNGTLDVLNQYSLKTVDSQGGFIATDWILDENQPNQRCTIKVIITSQELISTGVNTKILCQNKKNNEWYPDNKSFIDEEKKITLRILETASKLSLSGS